MRFGVIIPTIGRPDDLEACLLSIARENASDLVQVVLIDDGAPIPVEATVSIDDVQVDVFRFEARRGAAFARNFALTKLRPDITAVAFLDDDARLCPDWLKIARRELTPDRLAITGPVRRFDNGIVSHARQLRYDRRYAGLVSGQAVDFLAGGNSVVQRHALDACGGFPDTATMSDRLLVQRLEKLGGGCHFVNEMYILHRNSKGLPAAVKEAWKAGILDESAMTVRPLRRLLNGAGDAITSPVRGPAMLNVFLDAIYLQGRSTGARRRQSSEKGV